MNNNNYLLDAFTAVVMMIVVIIFIIQPLLAIKKHWKRLFSIKFDMYLVLFMCVIFVLLRHYIFSYFLNNLGGKF